MDRQSGFGESLSCCCWHAPWDGPCLFLPTLPARLSCCGMSFLYCAGVTSLPARGARGLALTVRWRRIAFLRAFLNGIFIANVRRVFLLGRNTGKHMLRSHLFIILNCSALLGKSILPFNIESPGQVAPGESPRKGYSFGEAAAGRNQRRLSSAGVQKLQLNNRRLDG